MEFLNNITFGLGAPAGSQECFNVSLVLVDSILEGNELVTIDVFSDDAFVEGDISLTIVDEDDIEGTYGTHTCMHTYYTYIYTHIDSTM